MSEEERMACCLSFQSTERRIWTCTHQAETIARAIVPYVRQVFVERGDPADCRHDYHAVCDWGMLPPKRFPLWYAFHLREPVLFQLLADTVRNARRRRRLHLAPGYSLASDRFVLIPIEQDAAAAALPPHAGEGGDE